MVPLQKVTPCLWYDGNAEAAVNHYLSIFKDGQILDVARYGDAGPGPKGTVLTIRFEIAGQQFIALNGGPQFKFAEAISLSVDCKDQAEVDDLWEKLSQGGSKVQCGWLKDKFGLSWQIVPRRVIELLAQPDAAKSNRVMPALLKMQKLDVAALEAAAFGS
jgi:predicted 3-demethylubiquinone-9 3-methyltransferase (glyoxalase superfamily)